MGKILAIDFGFKRVGYAVADEEQKVVFPREAIANTGEAGVIAALGKIVKEEGITKIVLGVPLDSDNAETSASKHIRTFGEKLAGVLGLPIFYVDEFGSSDEALSKIPFRKDRRDRKTGQRDSIAAQIILERYLGQ